AAAAPPRTSSPLRKNDTASRAHTRGWNQRKTRYRSPLAPPEALLLGQTNTKTTITTRAGMPQTNQGMPNKLMAMRGGAGYLDRLSGLAGRGDNAELLH